MLETDEARDKSSGIPVRTHLPRDMHQQEEVPGVHKDEQKAPESEADVRRRRSDKENVEKKGTAGDEENGVHNEEELPERRG